MDSVFAVWFGGGSLLLLDFIHVQILHYGLVYNFYIQYSNWSDFGDIVMVAEDFRK